MSKYVKIGGVRIKERKEKGGLVPVFLQDPKHGDFAPGAEANGRRWRRRSPH
jgi:hypothetical protein